MDTNLKEIIDNASFILRSLKESPNEEKLAKVVNSVVTTLELGAPDDAPFNISDDQKAYAVRELLTRFNTHMDEGTIFQAEDYEPWLNSRQGDIEWFYWSRYKDHLIRNRSLSPHVVRTLDSVTDNVLDHLEDPKKDGKWDRRGLVVGHVQSGKTANYTGLICKSADAGYSVIIVLAGLLNSLRNQTQERIDSDFMGWCTRHNKWIGAARIGFDRRPICLTTAESDFNKKTASTNLSLASVNEPVIVVVKKNKHSLERLHQWLSGQNSRDLKGFPMLLVDDEADHASINTRKEGQDPTTINRAIRDLLELFPRSSYVGYTATPFANIFIDPEDEMEMQNGEAYQDLFPRDFILSLDPPDNYVGPNSIFPDEGDSPTVRFITDNEGIINPKHKIDFVPDILPGSLEDAIRCFIIIRSIRILRGQTKAHHSMMINVSRFTGVQNLLKGLVHERVKDIRISIGNYSKLSPREAAAESPEIVSLERVWRKEFEGGEFHWKDILGCLKEAIGPIEVISVNSASSDVLDYSRRAYPAGRSVITIGGLGLSRGLTLEGLSVSYFLRNSVMYDTLMQMGRWFGYRNGYGDLCRIFMKEVAYDWYAHIARATDELRSDFRRMKLAKMTPLEFGLRVRSHPAALIVTARNKMRNARKVPVNISLAGSLAETSIVSGLSRKQNFETLETLVHWSKKEGSFTASKFGPLWCNVPSQRIRNMLEAFENHPECLKTWPEPLIEQILWMENNGNPTFDVLLRSVSGSEKTISFAGEEICPPTRTPLSYEIERVAFSKRRVASRGDERAGLTEVQVAHVKALWGEKAADHRYRIPERNPLCMLNIIIPLNNDKDVAGSPIPTYSLSFPRDPLGSVLPLKTVKYEVNRTWWNDYIFTDETEEEDE